LLFSLCTFLRVATLESEARVSIQQGEFDRAASILEQAVAIRDRFLPDAQESKRARDNLEGLKEICALLTASDQPDDADEPAESLDEQTERLRDEGKYAEAEPVAKRAIAKRLQKHGVDHPSTATSINNLAELYKSQGKYDEAEPLFERALAIYEKALGPDHPSTATSINNLARLREEQSKAAASAK
jgi:tetratricopeptide (TPR) repeat protein